VHAVKNGRTRSERKAKGRCSP